MSFIYMPLSIPASCHFQRIGNTAHRVANENNRVELHPTPPNSGAKMASQQGTLQEPCTDDLAGNSHKLPVPHALELCNVGLMVSVLQKEMKKDSSMAFVPYSPVESDIDVPCYTLPQSISEIEHNRVNDFYDELEELLDSMSSCINPGDTTFSYSRRKMVNVNKYSSVPHKVMTEYDLLRKRERFVGLYRDRYINHAACTVITHWVLTNTLRTSAIHSVCYPTCSQVLRMQWRPTMLVSEVYVCGLQKMHLNPFVRKERYNTTKTSRSSMNILRLLIPMSRASVRKDTSVMILSSQSSCYKCNQPGHHAKDCRYIPT